MSRVNVVLCSECRGLFSFLPRGLCAACIDRFEERLWTVREWLAANGGGTIMAASKGSGVERRIIAGFVREGRLDIVNDDPEMLQRLQREELVRARIAGDMAARELAENPPPDKAHRGIGMRSKVS